MADEQKKESLSIPMGTAIVAFAFACDAVIFILDWTVIGLVLAWAVSLFAYIALSIWLALVGAYSLVRGIIMVAPFAGGCVGIPDWGATMWIMVARTIAADKLGKLAPGVGAIANKVIK